MLELAEQKVALIGVTGGRLLLDGQPVERDVHPVDQHDVDRHDEDVEDQRQQRTAGEQEGVEGRNEEVPSRQAAEDSDQRSRRRAGEEGRDDDGRKERQIREAGRQLLVQPVADPEGEPDRHDGEDPAKHRSLAPGNGDKKRLHAVQAGEIGPAARRADVDPHGDPRPVAVRREPVATPASPPPPAIAAAAGNGKQSSFDFKGLPLISEPWRVGGVREPARPSAWPRLPARHGSTPGLHRRPPAAHPRCDRRFHGQCPRSWFPARPCETR